MGSIGLVSRAVSCFRAEAEEAGVQPVLRVPLPPGRGLGAPVHQPAQQGRCLARGNIHNRVIFHFFVGIRIRNHGITNFLKMANKASLKITVIPY